MTLDLSTFPGSEQELVPADGLRNNARPRSLSAMRLRLSCEHFYFGFAALTAEDKPCIESIPEISKYCC